MTKPVSATVPASPATSAVPASRGTRASIGTAGRSRRADENRLRILGSRSPARNPPLPDVPAAFSG